MKLNVVVAFSKIAFLGISLTLFACQKKSSDSTTPPQSSQNVTPPESSTPPTASTSPAPTETPTSPTPAPIRYLYFAAGGCYAGGLGTTRPTATSSSGLISRINLTNAQLQAVPIIDYLQYGLNLWPVGITNYDKDYLLANIMTSSSGFRIDKIKKNSILEKTDYLVDLTNLNTPLRSISKLTDGSILISRSTMIEKYNSSNTRVLNTLGNASYISNPLDVCSNSKTIITSALQLPNNQILFTHAGGATNNRLAIVDKDGYDATTDCKSAYTFSAADSSTSPATVAVPTAAVLIPNTSPYQLIVATTATVASHDQLWLFTINPTTNAITYVKSLYNDGSFVKGATAMTYDSTDNSLYVANGSIALGNSIEKFTYDSTTQTLLRTTSTFLGLNFETQCINSMFIDE